MDIKKLVLFPLAALVLSGCASGDEFTSYTQSIDSSNKSGQQVLVSYFNKKATDNENVFKALSGGNDPTQAQNNQMAIVLYTLLSQQNDEAILRHFTPKYADRPTTNADIGKSLADNFLPTLVKWGAGAWLGGEIVDGLKSATTLGAGATLVQQKAGGNISGTTIEQDYNSLVDADNNGINSFDGSFNTEAGMVANGSPYNNHQGGVVNNDTLEESAIEEEPVVE
jgi:hypothetical protein